MNDGLKIHIPGVDPEPVPLLANMKPEEVHKLTETIHKLIGAVAPPDTGFVLCVLPVNTPAPNIASRSNLPQNVAMSILRQLVMQNPA